MKALRKHFKMHMRITGINHLIGEEFQSAAPFRQPQCAVERARVRHLARHPEVYSNLFRTVDILNESPNKALKYSCTHFYLLMGTSSYNKGRKVQTGVHECIRENHP